MDLYNVVESYHLPASVTMRLTARECDILQWMSRGYTAKRIGLQLKISYRTVEKYIENIKIKFNCHRKYELMKICLDDPILRAFVFGRDAVV
jgi:DNA-binding CsgD family transcriptional regulator